MRRWRAGGRGCGWAPGGCVSDFWPKSERKGDEFMTDPFLADPVSSHPGAMAALGAILVHPGHVHGGQLTPRQEEVMAFLIAGRGDKEIADVMGITIRTVRAHLEAVRLKFGSPARAGVAVAFTLHTILACCRPALRGQVHALILRAGAASPAPLVIPAASAQVHALILRAGGASPAPLVIPAASAQVHALILRAGAAKVVACPAPPPQRTLGAPAPEQRSGAREA